MGLVSGCHGPRPSRRWSDGSSCKPFFGCTLLVAPGVATALATCSTTGFASVPLSVPNTASLIGEDFYFQGASLQPTSANGFQLSAGLSIVLGP